MRSERFKNWVAELDPKTCKPCEDNHGKVYEVGKPIWPRPPAHLFCRCKIRWLGAIEAGTATHQMEDGADFWLEWIGVLPDYYITSFGHDILAMRRLRRRGLKLKRLRTECADARYNSHSVAIISQCNKPLRWDISRAEAFSQITPLGK